jgi:hypothetical protein
LISIFIIIRAKKIGFAALLLGNKSLLGLEDIIIFLEFGVFLEQLVDLLIHDGVVAGLEDGQVVDSLLLGLDLLFQFSDGVAALAQLFLQLFVLVDHLLPQVLLFLQLVPQVLGLDLVLRDLLPLLLQVLFCVAFQFLLHPVPLLLPFFEVLTHVVVLPRLLLQLFLDLLLLLPEVLEVGLQLAVLLFLLVDFSLKVSDLSFIGIPLILSLLF